MRELKEGELLEKGDLIYTKSPFFERKEKVSYTTKTMAIYKGDYVSKYSRVYDQSFRMIPYDREQCFFTFKVYTNRD